MIWKIPGSGPLFVRAVHTLLSTMSRHRKSLHRHTVDPMRHVWANDSECSGRNCSKSTNELALQGKVQWHMGPEGRVQRCNTTCISISVCAIRGEVNIDAHVRSTGGGGPGAPTLVHVPKAWPGAAWRQNATRTWSSSYCMYKVTWQIIGTRMAKTVLKK